MRLTRVHVAMALSAGTEIALPEGPATHLSRVLRLVVGDQCVLFNGDGHDYPARVSVVEKRDLRVVLGQPESVNNESPLRIVLLQGVARGEKMDLILQKATELGVAEVRPLISQRSEVKLDADRATRRLAHWQAVVIAACEQSGRAQVPEVSAPLSLTAVLSALAERETGSNAAVTRERLELRLILDPHGSLSFNGLPVTAATALVLAVGPEGGWSPTDRAELEAAGFKGLRLGPRILRTETAGLAAIAALQAGYGDLA